jgi:hypothetical protein
MRQIAEIQAELAQLTEQRDRIDTRIMEVRAEAQEAIEGLQQLLGQPSDRSMDYARTPATVPVMPRTRRAEPERDLTDFDVYGADTREDGVTAEDFRAELAELRAHNLEKRRRLS